MLQAVRMILGSAPSTKSLSIARYNVDALMTMRRRVEELLDLEDRLRQGGGAKKIEKQHRDGKLTARERIARLIDPGAFLLETGLLVAHDAYDGQAPAAGVVTGLSRIEGRPAVIVANDATVKAGAWWPETITKILRAQEIAMRNRLPIVYLVDSAGSRLAAWTGPPPARLEVALREAGWTSLDDQYERLIRQYPSRVDLAWAMFQRAQARFLGRPTEARADAYLRCVRAMEDCRDTRCPADEERCMKAGAERVKKVCGATCEAYKSCITSHNEIDQTVYEGCQKKFPKLSEDCQRWCDPGM